MDGVTCSGKAFGSLQGRLILTAEVLGGLDACAGVSGNADVQIPLSGGASPGAFEASCRPKGSESASWPHLVDENSVTFKADLIDAFEACDALSGGVEGSQSATNWQSRLRPDVKNALFPAGASTKLVRAVRGLYDDTDSIGRRPWLLQPVLRSATPSTPSKGSNSRPPSAGRLGGPPSARPASAGPGRPLRQPESARIGSGGSSAPAAQTVDPDPPSIGRRPVSPVLNSSRRPRPSSARPPGTGDHNGITAPQRAAAQALAMMSAESEEEQEARQLKQAKIRAWLQRKEAEILERQRAEENEVQRQCEEIENRQRMRRVREAEEQRRKRGRLQAETRRKQKFVVEARGIASMASALEAYGGKPRPLSACARGGIVRLSG